MKSDLEKIITSGIEALQEGKYKEAQQLFQRALKEAETGQDKLLVAFCRDQIGETFFQLSEYGQAESNYAQAYQIRRQLLNPGHEDIIGSLNNLSSVYFFQGKYQLAKPLCEQLVAIYETILGKDHPEIATCLINLGLIAMAEGKFGQAEKYYTKAHAIRQTTFGEEHVLFGNSLSHLGSVYLQQKRFDASTKALRTALVILEKTLGPEHPDLEKVLSRLVDSLEAEGRNAEAERLYPHLVSLKEISLGPAHPEVVVSLEKVAAAYLRQGKPDEAAKLYQRLLAMKRRSFGDIHPQVAAQLTNLAFVQQSLKLSAQAESLLLQALHIYENNSRQSQGSVDNAHAQFLSAIKNLATFFDSDQRFPRSEKEWKRLIQLAEGQAKKFPELLALAYERLSNCLIEQNKNEEAELILRKDLAFQQSLGSTPASAEIRQQAALMTRLADILKQAGKHSEAESYYQQALDQLIKALGPNHQDLIPIMEGYAELLSQTYREAEAENMLTCARNLIIK